MATGYKLASIEWVGNHPALDFINTVDGWKDCRPGGEYLRGYPELLEWHQMANLVGPAGTRSLSRGDTRAKSAAHARALELRSALQRTFRAVAIDQPLSQEHLDVINEAVRDTAAWRRLTVDDGIISCVWDFEGAPPVALVGPVAWQAADLLEHGALDRIKQCPDEDGCGWLFLDTSKNRSRTWCSMKACGNAAKVKRFRARHS